MQVPKFTRAAILCLCIFGNIALPAQTLDKEEKAAAIRAIAGYIAANYVFPEKGGQIASHIQSVHFRGEFDKAATWKEFDKMVTESLQRFSGDRHLYVKNNPHEVRKLKLASGGGTETIGNEDEKDAEGNYGISESKVLTNNIGYLKLTGIDINDRSLPLLYAAMRTVENTDALIIDLRNNGGGGSVKGAVIESYFFEENTPLLDFTGRNGVMNTDSTVSWLKEKKYSGPVYVLINQKTASAAEALAFVLQKKKRAKVVAERSAGAAYKNDWFVVNDENYVSVSTASPNLHGTMRTWEGTGIVPDIKVKNDDALAFILNKIGR